MHSTLLDVLPEDGCRARAETPGRKEDRLTGRFPERYLPDAPFADQVTICQLLSHTSGMPDYGHLESYRAAVASTPSKPWTRVRFLDLADELGLGEQGKFQYSNIGYMLLVDLIEKLEACDFRTTLNKHIVKPLRLHGTFEVLRTDDECIVTGWSRELSGDPGDLPEELVVETIHAIVACLH